MDQQIQQAVEIALSGTADPELKSQAFQFINEIKSMEQGYRTCVDILLDSSAQGSKLNEGLQFFIFQVIDENIVLLGPEQLYTLNEDLFKHLNAVIANNQSDPAYLKNKMCEIFAHLFSLVYHNINAEFLSSLIALAQTKNPLAIDYYMRIMISIHFEVGDKLISRDKLSIEQNAVLKDLIRDRDMGALVASWKDVLTSVKDTTILDNALKVVGYFIDWMDFALFIQNGFLNVIYEFLKLQDLRIQASLTLIEIISKKMKPASKLELINMLDLASIIASIKDDDLDFIESLAKLANQMGLELCIALENETSLAPDINTQFLKLWPIVLEFLSHEYDDISQQVFPFIQQYLLISKKITSLATSDLLSTLLKKIIQKMKYDPESDGFDEDEQFADIRLKLKTFQDTIAILNPPLYLEILPSIIESSIFGSMASESWVSIELGLFELSNFGDSLKNNLINLPKNEISTSKPYQAVQDFLIKIIKNFNMISHPANQLAFFELIIRHFSTKNFTNTTSTNLTDLIIKVMELFSECGLFNGVETVRLRCWYLFFRFVNATKPKLNDFFLESIMMKIQPLLVVKAELPTRDEDDDLVEHGNFNSQLYLFEALGMLVALSESPNAAAKSVDILLQPLFNSLEACISRGDKDVNALIPLQVHHLLMAIATIVKGLDTQAPGKSENVKSNPEMVAKIGNAAQVVLISLENFNKSEIVRDSARFAFARFVPILDIEISAHLSKLISLILATANLKMQELGDFSGFIGQLVHQFKNNDIIFNLLNDLLTPMIQKIFDTLAIGTEGDLNMVREQYDLRKSLLSFISILVLNNQFSLLLTETNKPILPRVLNTIVEYASDMEEPSTTKWAITQFGNVVTMIAFNNGKIVDTKDKFAATVAPIEGIDEFLMENAVKLCFEVPFEDKEFDLKDAQHRNIAVEFANLLKTCQSRLRGGEFVNYLGNYLLNMGLAQDLAKDFCTKMVEMDAKNFKKYYISFMGELKG